MNAELSSYSGKSRYQLGPRTCAIMTALSVGFFAGIWQANHEAPPRLPATATAQEFATDIAAQVKDISLANDDVPCFVSHRSQANSYRLLTCFPTPRNGELFSFGATMLMGESQSHETGMQRFKPETVQSITITESETANGSNKPKHDLYVLKMTRHLIDGKSDWNAMVYPGSGPVTEYSTSRTLADRGVQWLDTDLFEKISDEATQVFNAGIVGHLPFQELIA